MFIYRIGLKGINKGLRICSAINPDKIATRFFKTGYLIKKHGTFLGKMTFVINMGKKLSIAHYFTGASDFEERMRPHVTSMYRFAWRLTESINDAEDLVQDVLVKIYPKRRELKNIENLRAWASKILFRTFIDQRRRAARSPLHLLAETTEGGSSIDTIDNLVSNNPGPEEIVDRNMVREKLWCAVRTLNEDQRYVCILHDMEGYALTELVEILEAPLGTLKSRLHRARENLKKLLWDDI